MSVEMEAPIASAKIKQWVEARFEGGLFHLSDQDEMVPAIMNRMAGAFKHRKRIEEDRHAMLAHTPRSAAEAVFDSSRKGDRGRLLPGLKDIDRKIVSFAQRPGAGGRLCNTNEEQRRIEA